MYMYILLKVIQQLHNKKQTDNGQRDSFVNTL